MATTINAGRVRFVSRGTYNNSTQYYLFDLVDYNGSSYIAKENTLGNLPTNTQYWQLIAEKGNTGNTGQTGPVGPTGNGIASIIKTGTSGLVDTYTITYTNGNTTTFTVTNGEDGEVTETELNMLRDKIAEQESIINQMPQVTDEGYDATLNGTIKAPFRKFDLSGHSEQESTEGYNIYYMNYANRTDAFNGTNITSTKTGYSISGTATATNAFTWTPRKLTLPPGTYTFGLKKASALKIGLSRTNYTRIETLAIGGTRKTFTLSEETDICLTIEVTNGTTYNEENEVMIYSGTEEKSFEEYTFGASPNPNYEQPIESAGDNGSITEKIVNKNFLKVKPGTYQDVRQEITATVNENGTIHVAGATTSNVAHLYMPLDKDLMLLPNDYHWSSKNIGTLPSYTTALRVLTTNAATDTNSFANTFLSLFRNETDYKNATITQKTTYKYFYIYIAANTTVDFTIDTQIELGSTGSDIVPHEEQTYSIYTQQPFRSIGDVRDCFVKKSDGWYERHNIGEVILDGTENAWSKSSTTSVDRYIYDGDFNCIATNNNLCNYFKYNQGATNKNTWYTNNDTHLTIFNFSEPGTTTLEQWKEWLSTHNLKLIQPLATPLDLPCTEAQIAILENLPSTYTGQTIVYSEDEVEPYMEVAGLLDLNTLVNN